MATRDTAVQVVVGFALAAQIREQSGESREGR